MKKLAFVLTAVLLLLSGCNGGKLAEGLSAANESQDEIGPVLVTAPSEIYTVPESSAAIHSDGSVAIPEGDTVVIREKMFIAQTNDIYFNAGDYLGKTIQYEGIFNAYTMPDTGITYYSVIRYGPGCCGVDANAGFEVLWDAEYPASNDWVEAVGVLEEYEENGTKYLRLALSSLTVLTTRGAEYVAQ